MLRPSNDRALREGSSEAVVGLVGSDVVRLNRGSAQRTGRIGEVPTGPPAPHASSRRRALDALDMFGEYAETRRPLKEFGHDLKRPTVTNAGERLCSAGDRQRLMTAERIGTPLAVELVRREAVQTLITTPGELASVESST